MPSVKDLIKILTKMKNVKKAMSNAPYVGIKPGLYGDGDKLLGVSMPDIRKSIKDFQVDLSLKDVQVLLDSEFHEIRMSGVLILVHQYKKCSTAKGKKKLYEFYILNVGKKKINNWDFIDISAPHLSGDYLFGQCVDHGRNVLLEFSNSQNLWLRRVAVISTFYHIRQNEFDLTVELGKCLLQDEHHLIHKAVGWMLREVGKRNESVLINFLDDYHQDMPRIMLSYSMEKLTQKQRKHYLAKK
ncbi:uncharacterized protein [Clytia hemisphaerica]|uniref:uncharacterized protein n=1 Tax=Clytia hemisphaerica TaxID=252671 RepID=UPI0034D63632